MGNDSRSDRCGWPTTSAVSEEDHLPHSTPGVLRVDKRAVLVGTGSAPVELGEVGPHGRKAMTAADWARGARITSGEPLDA